VVEQGCDDVAVQTVQVKEFFWAREDPEVGSVLLESMDDALSGSGSASKRGP
jgi:hypothetical protein